LDINWTQRLTIQSYENFYQNLQSFYNKHNYAADHIWNSNETSIQAKKQSWTKVFAKWGSHHVYNTIPKSKEWMTVNCVVNAKGATFLRFYTFRRDYIQLCKLRTCKAMQSKAWMTTFLFKKILSFLKRSIPSGISQQICIYSSWMGMDPMSPLKDYLNKLNNLG